MTSTTDALRAMELLDDDEVLQVLGNLFGERASFRLMRDDLLAVLGTAMFAPRVRDALTQAALPDGVGTNAAEHMRQLRVEAAARAAILGEAMLDSTQVAELVGSPGQNPRDLASTWRRSGAVVGLDHAGKYWYPAFQFDARHGRVRPVVKEVNERLRATDDPWGVASWWLSPSGRRRDHKSPADLAVAGNDSAVRMLAATLVDRD